MTLPVTQLWRSSAVAAWNTRFTTRRNSVFYSRLRALILLVYALVLTSDWIGERLRLRVA